MIWSSCCHLVYEALACTRDWKISILMAVVMPIAGLCMALSVEVVRNFSMVVEACYAKAGEVCVPRLPRLPTILTYLNIS